MLSHWNVRRNRIDIAVCESISGHIYVSVASIRQVIPALASDAQLQKAYGLGIGPMQKGGSLYFSEPTLRRELKRMSSAEASMLEDWLHHNVFYPAAKKRGNERAFQATPKTLNDAQPSSASPPPSYWARQSEKTSFSQWLFLPFTRHWKGQNTLGKTTIEGTILACLMLWFISIGIRYVFEPDHYYGNWVAFQASALSLIVSLGAVWVWWGVGVMRFALRSIQSMRSIGSAFLIFLLGLLVMIAVTASTIEESFDWLRGVMHPLEQPQVTYDATHDRIVFDGDVSWGAYRLVQKAISEHPTVKLIELNSPGGFVIEGFAIARLVKQSALDTVTFDDCASSCTLIFAAGKARYLGPRASIGFHRSYTFGKEITSGWSSTEYKMSAYLKQRGVEDAFIQTAFSFPGDDLWEPSHAHMLDAGYATSRWKDR